MQTFVFIFVLPVSAVVLFVACLFWLMALHGRRVKAFAAQEGIAFRSGDAPIAMPQVVYEKHGGINGTSDFLYGMRHGVEVFACNFHIGSGRGNATTLSMVAVRAELHNLNGLDLKRWEMMPLNGWNFLVPRKPNGSPLNTRKIAALWDALTAAAQSVDMKTSGPNAARES